MRVRVVAETMVGKEPRGEPGDPDTSRRGMFQIISGELVPDLERWTVVYKHDGYHFYE